MVWRIVAVWSLVSIWGCAHPVVQPDTQERSAIAFAQHMVKEMSQGLEKLRVSLGTTVQERGTYRVLEANFFPQSVTMAHIMQNFARFCTQVGGTMVLDKSVCQASPAEANQVKFLVRIEDQSPKKKQFVRMHVRVYEPIGAPSAEFLRAIRPYRKEAMPAAFQVVVLDFANPSHL